MLLKRTATSPSAPVAIFTGEGNNDALSAAGCVMPGPRLTVHRCSTWFSSRAAPRHGSSVAAVLVVVFTSGRAGEAGQPTRASHRTIGVRRLLWFSADPAASGLCSRGLSGHGGQAEVRRCLC